MHDYKKNFENVVRFGISKIEIKWWRVILMGILGGIYISLSYYGFIKVLGLFVIDPSAATLEIRPEGYVAAASVFPVGLIFVVFLGASVFNGDNLSIMAFLFKKVRFHNLLTRWTLVLFSNFAGSLLMGWLFSLANAWNSQTDIRVITILINNKLFVDEAWNIFFSAIISNIVIVGTLWASFAPKNAIGKIVIIWLPIFLLAIAGFNHIPVNFALYAIGLVRHHQVADALASYHASNAAQVAIANAWGAVNIYWVLLPTLAGNIVSGVFFMPLIYFFILQFKNKKEASKELGEFRYEENHLAVATDHVCYITEYSQGYKWLKKIYDYLKKKINGKSKSPAGGT